MAIPDGLLGPLALTVGALFALGYVSRLALGFLREYIASIIADRDAWKARSLASDERLERLADAFEAGFKKAAPK